MFDSIAYLLGTYWPLLLVAFVIGLVVGWLNGNRKGALTAG
jgi:flagellar biosynthesis protein FliQ